MNVNRFLQHKTATLISALLLMFTVSACQAETTADKGPAVDSYTVLPEAMTPSSGNKIEVIELFWYGCGHCFALEPYVDNWKKKNKPANVEFVKVPAIFSSRWEFHGKAFYTMEALGVLEQANDAFFHRIHVAKRGVNSLNGLVDFLAAYGKTAEEVTGAFNSFAVDSKLRNAKIITAKSSATGVPAIIVDGKYHTSVQLAGSQDNLFKVVNKLSEKAASER